MKNRKIESSAQAGFTLIELMIVIAILGILMVPLIQMYMNARKLSEDHLLFTRASAALAQQAEIVKSTPYEALKIGNDRKFEERVASLLRDVPGGSGSVEVGVRGDAPEVKWVTVRVGWQSPWGKQKTLHTVIVRSGP